MSQIELSAAGLSVMLAMPVHRDIPWQTCKSLIETQFLLQSKGVALQIQMQIGSSRVTAARSRATHEFLATANNRLFFVDSDMEWRAEDFLRLVLFSSKMSVVCGAYPTKREPPSFQFDMGRTTDIVTNEYGCIPINGLGMGFMVVERSIIEALADAAPKVIFPDVTEKVARIFREDIHEGLDRGEDMAFCADVRALGHSIWMDPTVTLGHIGSKTYIASISDLIVQQEPA